MEGNWLGSWAGKWYGAGAETPEGSIAGSSSITVTASGIPSALAYILGAAGLTINGNGSLTSSGGEVSNPTLDLILAILTGRKVYDPETKLWHVFDANGIELVDTSGVLMQGLHGWLLREANQRKTTEVIVAGGPDASDSEYEREEHFQAQRKVGEKLYAKPVEIVQPEAIALPPEPLAVNVEPRHQPVNVADLTSHKQDLALLSEELNEIQQSITEIANDAIAKARRRREEEEFLLLFL